MINNTDCEEALAMLIEKEMIEQPCGYFFKDPVLEEAFDQLVDDDKENYCDQFCGNETGDMINCWCKFAKLVKENEERRNKS